MALENCKLRYANGADGYERKCMTCFGPTHLVLYISLTVMLVFDRTIAAALCNSDSSQQYS
jgi:hypothetical protein